MKRNIRKSFIIVPFLILLLIMSVTAQASSKKIDNSSIKGKCYFIDDVTVISKKGSKIALTGSIAKYDIKTDKFTKMSFKTRTYKVNSKVKKYFFDDTGSYYCGKMSISSFMSYVNQRIASGFPSVRFWVVNGKITAYGLSS